MPRSRSAALLCALALCALVGASFATSGRIREHEITLNATSRPYSGGLLEGEVPVVDPPKRVAGYFRLNRTHAAEMFYFYFQARRAPENAPVVLWMTGGPGCSSELAVLYENGPYSLDAKGRLQETQYGWDVYHHMIFVDQPINTGFSYSDDDRDRVYDESGVAEDMLDFLTEFFEVHPELADRPFYITGESYAGHYVPAVSHRVWLYNKEGKGKPINLQGLAVGNGLTDPTIQFGAYGDYAHSNGLIGTGLRDFMSFLLPPCRWASELCDSTNWSLPCELGLQYCMMTQFQPVLGANPDINVYDITKTCDAPLCYDFSPADKFLNDPAVQHALGVKDREWVGCNMDVHADMSGDWLHKWDTILPDMMADGVRVMIYAGDLDLICNYLGNQRWVDALPWEGAEAWAELEPTEWQVLGAPAGTVKQLGPLSFVRVFKAGHMVPMDQPLNALAMITAFTRNHSVIAQTSSSSSSTASFKPAASGKSAASTAAQAAARPRAGGSGRAANAMVAKMLKLAAQSRQKQQQQAARRMAAQ